MYVVEYKSEQNSAVVCHRLASEMRLRRFFHIFASRLFLQQQGSHTELSPQLYDD